MLVQEQKQTDTESNWQVLPEQRLDTDVSPPSESEWTKTSGNNTCFEEAFWEG